MITHDIDGEIEITGIDNITEMGMKLTGKAYGLMIDKLYTRKEDAVVRELGANARDAMKDLSIKLGTPMQPFSIQLPNDITHELIIKDNGTGLSKDNVQKYLGNLFESSKEKENTSIGAYGLGSKSPFAVTDQYMIESRFEGELHNFSFFRAKGGIPKLVHLSTFPTTEPNGITFKVPAPPNRYHTYAKAVAAQLFFFNPRPNVGARTDIWDEYGTVAMEQDNWKMIKSSGLREYYGSTLANMGGVSYPLDTTRLSEIDTDDDYVTKMASDLGVVDLVEFKNKLTQRASQAHNDIHKLTRASGNDVVFALFFNIGDLEVPPSREMLEYDAQTSYNIIVGIENLVKQISDKFVAHIQTKADPKKPQELRDILVDMCKIINWENNNYNVAPDSFSDPIRKLEWEINVATDMPPVLNGYGELVDSKCTVSAAKPSIMLTGLAITFPHYLKDRTHEEVRRWACDENGIISNIDTTPASTQGTRLIKEGYLEIKRTVTPTKNLSGDGFMVVITYKRDWKEWTPSLGMTPEISPTNNRVTAQVGNYKLIDSKPINEDVNGRDRWGTRINSPTPEIYILVDDEAKEKDLVRYGTWALRRSIGIDRKSSEVESLAHNPNDCRKHIRFVKGITKEDIEFFVKWNAKRKNKAEIWKLSDLVIPKPERRIGNSTLTMRGVKVINIKEATANRALDQINYGLYTSTSFGAIKVADKALPDFMVFNNGKNEHTYLDPELTIPVKIGELLCVISMLNRLQAPLEKSSGKETRIYRLTPINIKQLDKFKEQGFRVLYDALKAVGLNNTVGSSQFKRRYKASLLTDALYESDTYRIGEVIKPDDIRKRVFQSEFTKFTDHSKIECSKLVKHMNRLNRSVNGAHKTQKEMGIPLSFGYEYRNKYRPLTEVEALRVIIDEMYAQDWNLPKKLYPNGERPYFEKIVKHATKNFKRVRKNFLEDKFKEVLFSGFFARNTTEFENALKIAKVKLG